MGVINSRLLPSPSPRRRYETAKCSRDENRALPPPSGCPTPAPPSAPRAPSVVAGRHHLRRAASRALARRRPRPRLVAGLGLASSPASPRRRPPPRCAPRPPPRRAPAASPNVRLSSVKYELKSCFNTYHHERLSSVKYELTKIQIDK